MSIREAIPTGHLSFCLYQQTVSNWSLTSWQQHREASGRSSIVTSLDTCENSSRMFYLQTKSKHLKQAIKVLNWIIFATYDAYISINKSLSFRNAVMPSLHVYGVSIFLLHTFILFFNRIIDYVKSNYFQGIAIAKGHQNKEESSTLWGSISLKIEYLNMCCCTS